MKKPHRRTNTVPVRLKDNTLATWFAVVTGALILTAISLTESTVETNDNVFSDHTAASLCMSHVILHRNF